MSRHPWSPEVVALGERIAGLNVLAATQLLQYLKDAYGVSATACPVAIPVPELVPAPPPPTPTEFDVVLVGFDPARKINLIKVVRENTGLGLKDAKDLVELAPRTVREGLAPAEAARLKVALEGSGGRADLKPVE